MSIFAHPSNEFSLLLAQCMEELRMKTSAHDRLWHLSQASWAVDQDAGTIVFTRSDGVATTCAVQIIGTYNTADGTWLWGWDHPSVRPPLQKHARNLKSYGEEHGIAPLTTRKLGCTEQDAWEFAALACKLCDAQGAYRAPSGPARVFVTFSDIHIHKKPGSTEAAESRSGEADRSNEGSTTPDAAHPVDPASAESQPGELNSAPVETVRAFIAAHFDWNAAACERSGLLECERTGTPFKADESATKISTEEYAALIARFCTDSVKPQGISYGSNPMHSPEGESIEAVSLSGQTAIVRTRMKIGESNFAVDNEYHLVQQSGEWRIASVLYVDDEGKYECL